MIHVKQSLLLALLIITMYSAAAIARPDPSTETTVNPTGSGWYSKNRPAVLPNAGMVINQAEPYLQGATMGTIGPQGTDATVIQGIMTAGTVRVNNLANLEAALNLVANVALILGHIVGIYYLVKTIRITAKTPGNVLGGMAKGFSFISVGLLSPVFINWALASAQNAGLFN